MNKEKTMSLNVQLCPETGICSIIKGNGSKIDIISDEVAQLRQASGDSQQIKSVLGQLDPGFADSLSPEEIAQLSNQLD
jgi:hypothetical protein